MKANKVLILCSILISCSNESADWRNVETTICSIYGASSIEISEGIAIKNKTEHNYIEVTISGCKHVNEDTSYDISSMASGSAIVVFENLPIEKEDTSMTIDINIIQKVNDLDKEYSFSYPVFLIKSAYDCFPKIDSLFHSLLKKDYSKVYSSMSSSFIEFNDFKNFTKVFSKAENEMGELKSYKIRGFDIIGTSNNKSKKLIKFKIVCYRNIPQEVEVFFDPENTKELFGIQM